MRSQDFRPGGDGYAATIKLLFTIFMQNDRFRRILGVFFLNLLLCYNDQCFNYDCQFEVNCRPEIISTGILNS